jgi:hypothetical protein
LPLPVAPKAAGVKEIYIEDLREEFARDFVFPMFRANAIYEGEYLLLEYWHLRHKHSVQNALGHCPCPLHRG